MALIKCKECWNDVSKNAEICPHCGAKVKGINREKIFSVSTTIITIAMTAISIFIAYMSLGISDLALNTSSVNLEPIFEVYINDEKEELSLIHKTNEMYTMQFVIFGKVRTIAITNEDCSKISSIEVNEKYVPQPFKIVGSKEAGGLSEKEAKECNKKLKVSLNSDGTNEKKLVDQLERTVKRECKKNKNVEFWGVSSNFDFYYIDITYTDAQDKVKSAYYIYKNEYQSKWQLYRLTKEEYKKYTKNVLYSYGSGSETQKKVVKKLFSDNNFENFYDSKYNEFWEWFDLKQFE